MPKSRSAAPSNLRAGSQLKSARPASVEFSPPVAKQMAPESATGMQKLLDTMSALGMSTAGLDISYTEELVGYPGGSYVNRLINVTSGGKTERFGAELTAKNPLITAYEIQRYLGVVANASGASGVRQG